MLLLLLLLLQQLLLELALQRHQAIAVMVMTFTNHVLPAQTWILLPACCMS